MVDKDFVFPGSEYYERICNRDDDVEIWLARRRETVGASDRCDRTSFRRRTEENPKPFKGNRHTFFGSWMENPGLSAFGEWAGLEVASNDTLLRSKVHPHMSATPDGVGRIKHPGKFRDYLQYEMCWHSNDIKTLLDQEGEFLIEVKAPGWEQLPKWGKVGWREIKLFDTAPKVWQYPYYAGPIEHPPKDYYIQCQHQMVVTGYRVCLLLAIVGGKQFIVVPVYYHERDATKRIHQSEKFLQKVKKGVWD